MKQRLLMFLPLLLLAGLVLLFANRLASPRVTGIIDSPLIGKRVPLETKLEPPYMINFFASWCTPCLLEHPYLMKMKDRGVPIIGILYKDKLQAGLDFLEDNGSPYDGVMTDQAGKLGADFGITGVPETFVVDANGIIRARWQGPIADEDTIQELLKSIGR
jgi:cytochrome c biogenesis protein CcmG, thiol:disulfide interchange protein DsbE